MNKQTRFALPVIGGVKLRQIPPRIVETSTLASSASTEELTKSPASASTEESTKMGAFASTEESTKVLASPSTEESTKMIASASTEELTVSLTSSTSTMPYAEAEETSSSGSPVYPEENDDDDDDNDRENPPTYGDVEGDDDVFAVEKVEDAINVDKDRNVVSGNSSSTSSDTVTSSSSSGTTTSSGSSSITVTEPQRDRENAISDVNGTLSGGSRQREGNDVMTSSPGMISPSSWLLNADMFKEPEWSIEALEDAINIKIEEMKRKRALPRDDYEFLKGKEEALYRRELKERLLWHELCHIFVDWNQFDRLAKRVLALEDHQIVIKKSKNDD